MSTPYLLLVAYLSTPELGPLAEPSWRATALMDGGGAIGQSPRLSVLSPHNGGLPLTPGPWKAVVLDRCSLNPLLIRGELDQRKAIFQLLPPTHVA